MKIDMRRVEKHVMAASLGLGLSFIVIGFYMFGAGFHNLDLSWNMLRVAYYNDLDYDGWVDAYALDEDETFKTITYDECYVIGADQMRNALVLVFVGCLLFFPALTVVLIREEERWVYG